MQCLKGRRVMFLGDSLSNQQADSLLGMLGWHPDWMKLGAPRNAKRVGCPSLVFSAVCVWQKKGRCTPPFFFSVFFFRCFSLCEYVCRLCMYIWYVCMATRLWSRKRLHFWRVAIPPSPPLPLCSLVSRLFQIQTETTRFTRHWVLLLPLHYCDYCYMLLLLLFLFLRMIHDNLRQSPQFVTPHVSLFSGWVCSCSFQTWKLYFLCEEHR